MTGTVNLVLKTTTFIYLCNKEHSLPLTIFRLQTSIKKTHPNTYTHKHPYVYKHTYVCNCVFNLKKKYRFHNFIKWVRNFLFLTPDMTPIICKRVWFSLYCNLHAYILLIFSYSAGQIYPDIKHFFMHLQLCLS